MEEEEQINSYLTFKVNGGLYGVHVSKVVEIMAYEEPRSRSAAAPYMLGLAEHRDTVVPLIDSGLKFGLGNINITPQTYVVVVEVAGAGQDFAVALTVDEVREVVEIPEQDRRPIETSYKPGYVSFAAPTADGLAVVIDPDKVFSDTDIVDMTKAAGQAAADSRK